MNIKAVIMDGDGSTITHDNFVPNNLKNIITDKSHIKWIMATGRSLELLKKTPIFDYLSTNVLHIVDGGSRLMYLDGTCKTTHLMNSKYLDRLFSKLQLNETNFLYYSPDGKISYAYSPDINFSKTFKFHDEYVNYTNELQEFESWVYKYPPSKILLNVKDNFDLEGLYYHQNENNFDITDNNINKGSACVDLLKRMNLLPHEVVFIFNDKNDLPITEHPLLGEIVKIKVGNSLPNTYSQFHVETPYEVANILEKIL